ncbi:MAG: maleylpyruvate isomerase family mycothiol-dependent enzyme [Actinomycetota bacterium]|nr:maleylpyruvate isomerase family mycothiol-dependent enzyme [Actinomycetota bacterium]
MDVDAHLAALEVDGELLARAAKRAGMDAPVPTCSGWRVKELLRHIGFVHRWAATHVAQASPVLLDGPSEEEILGRGPGDDELLAWFRTGHADLVNTLRSADADLACWTFLDAPSPLAFWARRQAHETAIHRADAEAATGPITAVEPAFAADGIDELLVGFAPRERPSAAITRHFAMAIRSIDTGDEWLVTLNTDRVEAHRGAGLADGVMTGPASDLYLALWNRQAGDARLSVTGDPRGLKLWRAAMQVRWN